jgi:hypothetical protein
VEPVKPGLQRRIERERVLQFIEREGSALDRAWLPLFRWQHRLLRRREDPDGLVSTGVHLLLAGRPDWIIDHIDAQEYDPERDFGRGEGPWVCIDLRRGSVVLSRYAIWKRTGNVYRVGDDGAVEDDPVISVTPLGATASR